MTNNELYEKFIEIDSANMNIFDRKCALKKLENEYATTEFAQTFPDCNILEAYTLFYEDITNIGTLIRNFKDETLPELLEHVVSKLDLGEMFGQLDPSVAELLRAFVPEE